MSTGVERTPDDLSLTLARGVNGQAQDRHREDLDARYGSRNERLDSPRRLLPRRPVDWVAWLSAERVAFVNDVAFESVRLDDRGGLDPVTDRCAVVRKEAQGAGEIGRRRADG